MPSQNPVDPRKNFAPRTLPWLLAIAMFAAYALTLNHWVSLTSLNSVTKISGWTWLPEVSSPLLFIVTYPFRWLPAAAVPLALNFFSAGCAALTLGLLARSVSILPHDRTDAQRKREKSGFAFLTTGSAWLPPLLAVAVCGFQLTFWEQATNFAGETFDLLLFAFIIWSLLEYRMDEREGRLYLAALVYGASMAENPAMVAFFPMFIGAIVWLRRLGFFDLHFLGRMTLCGLAGMLFYLLLPFVAISSAGVPLTFWQALKFNLSLDYTILKSYVYCILHPKASAEFLTLLLAYLLPLFVLSLRWKPSFGDSSRIGSTLTTFVFHLVHAAFLGLLIWMAFGAPFSPRHRGGGSPMLPLYYLGALSVGYYCGYFLLIFGKKEVTRSGQRSKSDPLQFLDKPVVAAVWVLAAVAVAGLIYRNLPQVNSTNGKMLRHYASLVTEKLPQQGGYLLSDDPQQLALTESALAQEGRLNQFVPLDTHSLIFPAYHRYLHDQFPQRWPLLVSADQTNLLNPVGLVQTLALLSKTNDLYYLHPSYGYYFEAFYAEPHGLVYKLKPLPADTLLPPKADAGLIAENEAFWTKEVAPSLSSIEQVVTPPVPRPPLNWSQHLLKKFHVEREENPVAFVLGDYYSRGLDFWGVELQRAGALEKAGAAFDTAVKLNPNNFVAGVNLDFNKKLRTGETVEVDLDKTSSEEIDKFGTWNDVLTAGGPFDEPSFCFRDGIILAHNNGFVRQAVEQFHRVCELAPDYLPAHYELAQDYLINHLPDQALAALQGPMTQPGKFSLGETNETDLHVLASAAYFQKNEPGRGAQLLETEIRRHPENQDLLNASAQVFIAHGLFTNALAVINRVLQFVPDDPTWLYNKGYVSLQLKRYDDAIAALSRVLSMQTNNDNALFNRAIANLQSGKLTAARSDFKRLQQSHTNSFQVAYGLGEIAWRQHDTNEAVRNYQIYLAGANTNTDEARTVLKRLREMQN